MGLHLQKQANKKQKQHLLQGYKELRSFAVKIQHDIQNPIYYEYSTVFSNLKIAVVLWKDTACKCSNLNWVQTSLVLKICVI